MPIQRNKSKYTPEQKKKMINIALAVFGISIVIFAVIGAFVMDSFSNLQQIEETPQYEDDNYKGEIDDRLRFIAMQENGETDNYNNELLDQKDAQTQEDENAEPEEIALFLENEEVKRNKFEEYNEKYGKKQADTSSEEKIQEEIKKEDVPYRKEAFPSGGTTLKVVIGNFQTKEAAQEELSQISAQFTAPPFIRMYNGRYIIQVGSFKNSKTAFEFSNSLKQQGYSARIIEE